MSELPVGPAYGFGLYVHWPYCTRICPYCDFNVYAAKDRDTGPLLEAILADIRRHHALLLDHPPLQSVFFGGGTPSLLSPLQVARVVDAARDAFDLESDAEITLEANPNDVLSADLAALANAGVNRLSIGVQSLRDDALAFLGRDHDAGGARRAVEAALGVFPSVSIDLIYARPGQTAEDWAAELETAIGLGAHHLSLYELTIEAATAFGRAVKRGQWTPMPDDGQAELYEVTQDITSSRGVPAYEISNHAALLRHASRHNGIYWASGDWIGVGPGAHGRLTMGGQRFATVAPDRPEDYIGQTREPAPLREPLTAQDVFSELVVMALRRSEGIEADRLAAFGSAAVNTIQLGIFVDEGLVETNEKALRLTPKGRLLADAIASRLIS